MPSEVVTTLNVTRSSEYVTNVALFALESDRVVGSFSCLGVSVCGTASCVSSSL